MRFLPGHWALGLWKIRASAAPFLRLSLPNQRSDSVFRRRGGPMWPPAGRSGTGPYENNTVAPISAVGAGPRPARKAFPWGPTPLVKGRWPKARGDRECEYGHASAHPEPSPGDSQGELLKRGKRRWPGPLVTFSSLIKSLAARRRRNPPKENPCFT